MSPSSSTHRRALLARPDIAWPSLLLTAGIMGGWLVVLWLMASGKLALPFGCLGASLLAYAAFTPMHEASHQSLGRAAWLNEVVGRMVGVLLLAPFAAFRFIHLTHHKYTNDPERDPDFWSGRGRGIGRIAFWMTQDFHSYVHYFRAWSTRPRSERWEVVGSLALFIAAFVFLTMQGYGSLVFWGWLVPARVAIAFLAFGFDFLPHYPYRATRDSDRYATTRVLDSSLLTPLLFAQNYHLIHHLYPAVPFYRYARIWAHDQHMLRAKGVEVIGRGA